MERMANLLHYGDDPTGETLADGLWLGGEAMVAPACMQALPTAERAGSDYDDPQWQVI